MIDSPGKQFGKYRLIAHLATGGMASIYLASQHSLAGFEKLLVIKRILPNLAEEESFVRMFLDEARIAAMLNHPNVVQIFDLGRIEGQYFIAMEYLSGESLSSVIRKCWSEKKVLPSELAAGIVLQAAEGLHHAHSMTGKEGKPLNIVHRDVSPQNIFVLYDGGVKVVDFGIAKAASRSTKTRTGHLKGKFSYMSPEQVLNRGLDARSDVFSLGILLWECLAGRKLYRQRSDLEILQAITGKDAPSPQTVNTKAPDALAEIALMALARKREERYQSAAELRSALGEYLRLAAAQADTMAIGRFMREMFADHIDKKRRLIENARAPGQDLHNHLFGDLIERASDTKESVPGYTLRGLRKAASRPRPSQWGWWRRPVVLLLILGIVAGMVTAGTYILATGDGDVSEPGSVDAGLVALDPKPEAGSAGEPDAWHAEEHGVASSTVSEVDLHGRPVDAGLSRTAEPDGSAKKRAEVSRVLNKTKGKKRHPGYGQLNLNTRPWTSIYQGKKYLGDTPLVGVKLRAGRHRLKAVNASRGIEEHFTVHIRRGKISKKNIEF